MTVRVDRGQEAMTNEVTELLGRIAAILERTWKGEAGGALERDEAAAYLSISVRQLDILASEGRVAKTKIGRKTVFQRKHLDSFLDRNTVMTREEVERAVAKL